MHVPASTCHAWLRMRASHTHLAQACCVDVESMPKTSALALQGVWETRGAESLGWAGLCHLTCAALRRLACARRLSPSAA